MALKYTQSIDGKMRANVFVEIRLTQEEYQAYQAATKAIGVDGIRDFLRIACRDALDWDLPRRYEEETGETFTTAKKGRESC